MLLTVYSTFYTNFSLYTFILWTVTLHIYKIDLNKKKLIFLLMDKICVLCSLAK